MRFFLRRIVFLLGCVLHHNHDSKVIYYHDVSKKYTEMGTDYGLMLKHIDIVRKLGYHIVPEISARKRQVMFCFDDGWAGIYDYKDEFVRMGIFPTIFIAVDLIGREGYLTEPQIKDLYSARFRFGAHTWSHRDLTSLTEVGGVEHELLDSKAELEKTFSHPFEAICFPMGRFSDMVVEKSSEYGYRQLFTSLPGGFYDLARKNLITRNCAQNVSPAEFRWMLNGTSLLFRRKLVRQHFEKNHQK